MAPSKSFCATHNSWFFVYKLYRICYLNGVFNSLGITKSEVLDIHFFKISKIKYLIMCCLETKVSFRKYSIGFISF